MFYQHDLYMLYPHSKYSFSANHKELGVHFPIISDKFLQKNTALMSQFLNQWDKTLDMPLLPKKARSTNKFRVNLLSINETKSDTFYLSKWVDKCHPNSSLVSLPFVDLYHKISNE